MMSKLINFLLDKLNILIIYRQGNALGDQICLTSVLKEIKKTYKKKIILFTPFPELFFCNQNINYIFKLKTNLFYKILLKIIVSMQGSFIIEYRTKEKDFENKYFLEKIKKPDHLAKIHAEQFLNLDIKENINCKFNFSEKELLFYQKKFDYLLNETYAIVQSETSKKFTNIKNWDLNKIQNIINFYNKIKWVQVGKGESILQNTIDLRNVNIREMAFIFKNSLFILCLESFYNHLASAFNKKVFLIASGFIPSIFFKYENTIVIKSPTKPECEPCFIKGNCPLKNKICTESISSDDVISQIKKYLK